MSSYIDLYNSDTIENVVDFVNRTILYCSIRNKYNRLPLRCMKEKSDMTTQERLENELYEWIHDVHHKVMNGTMDIYKCTYLNSITQIMDGFFDMKYKIFELMILNLNPLNRLKS